MTCITHHHACNCREAKVNKLVEALEFYADGRHLGEEKKHLAACGCCWITDSFEAEDTGETAIKALKEWRNQ